MGRVGGGIALGGGDGLLDRFDGFGFHQFEFAKGGPVFIEHFLAGEFEAVLTEESFLDGVGDVGTVVVGPVAAEAEELADDQLRTVAGKPSPKVPTKVTLCWKQNSAS